MKKTRTFYYCDVKTLSWDEMIATVSKEFKGHTSPLKFELGIVSITFEAEMPDTT